MSKSYPIKLMTILQNISFEEHKAQNLSNKLSILQLLQKKNYLLQFKLDNKISYENALSLYIHDQISKIVSNKGWFENILFNKNDSSVKITEKQEQISKAPINQMKNQNSDHIVNGSTFTQHRQTTDDTMMSFIKDSSYIQQLLQDGNGDEDSKETSGLNESPNIPVANNEKKRKALQSIPIDSIILKREDMTSFMQVQKVNNTELLAYDMSCMKLNQTSMIDFSVANQPKNNTSTFQPEKQSVNISQNRASSRQTPLLINNSNNLNINNNMNISNKGDMNNNSNGTNDISMLKSILRTNYNNSNQNSFHDNNYNNDKLACNMTTEISFLPDSNSTVITERLQQRKSLVFRQNRASSSNNTNQKNKKGDRNRISLFAFHENYEDIEEEDSLTYNEN